MKLKRFPNEMTGYRGLRKKDPDPSVAAGMSILGFFELDEHVISLIDALKHAAWTSEDLLAGAGVKPLK